MRTLLYSVLRERAVARKDLQRALLAIQANMDECALHAGRLQVPNSTLAELSIAVILGRAPPPRPPSRGNPVRRFFILVV